MKGPVLTHATGCLLKTDAGQKASPSVADTAGTVCLTQWDFLIPGGLALLTS